MFLFLGANPYENSVTNSAKKLHTIQTLQQFKLQLSDYSNALANYDGFPIDSAGGGYSHEAAPNGADIQIPQSLVWGKFWFCK